MDRFAGDSSGSPRGGLTAVSAFPTPWRVINADGSIPVGWKGLGGGPEKCRERLEAERTKFIDDRADPAKKMGWEELDALVKALGDDETNLAA